ncbi:hypothetical protein [Zavarzinia compransoris]|uniref:HD/PDEase domain-containing protein n=1 Tax=Zavarzinia compransoris TaxID=1264899 RepID=A0A317E552_9PROT|nr:hypothetical protein [Zavarzinia compransoris]PWR22197.1 hypothetical protein DKG75_09530 [Zavarzinia compransoris]TDP47050.1 3'5'-cyclic nucleotide phosphodiesterase family protein [Zavarzinia compransoris]
MTATLQEIAGTAGIDLAAEPFALVQGHTARRAARSMIGSYLALEAAPEPKLGPIADWVLAAYGFGPDHPYRRAAAPIAAAIERRDTPVPVNPYHNAHHTLEVLLNAHYLAIRNDLVATHIRLNDRERALLCLSALIHDYEHDGTMNGPTRFRLESLAYDTAHPQFRAAGMDEADCAAIRAIVLATDPAGPNLYMKALHSAAFYGGLPPEPGQAFAELKPLADDRRLLRMAALLNDADLLSSAGLSVDYADRQSAKLGAEGGRKLDCADMLRFLQHIVGGSFTTRAARFFNLNMFLIKSFAEMDVHDSNDGVDAPLIRP